MTLDLTQYPDGDLNGQTVTGLTISGRTFDPASPLVIRNGTIVGLAIRKCANLVIEADLKAPATEMVSGRPAALYVGDSSNIKVGGAAVKGPDGVPVEQMMDKGSCIHLERVTGFELLDSDLSNSYFGLTAALSSNIRVLRNKLHDIKVDMARIISCQGGEIGENLFTRWRSPNVSGAGDHTDAIQMFNMYNQLGVPNKDFEIYDNLIWQDDGSPAQGIFIQMGAGWAPPENINLRRNIVIGGLGNGIVHPGTGVVEDNIVVPYAKQKNWLMWSGPASKILRNKAARFTDNDSDSGSGKDTGFYTPTPPTNELIAPVSVVEAQAMAGEWMARVFGSPSPAPQPVPVPEPAPVDPAPVPVPDTPPVSAVTPLTAEQKAMVLSAVSAALDGLG